MLMVAEKFRNKYRIQSIRLQNWDYGWNAAYFITICTQDRELYFGDIVDGKMKLSELGIIANILWYEIKNHAKNIELDSFVIMPNHIHGILILNNNNDTAETRHAIEPNAETRHATKEETRHALSLKPSPPPQPQKSPPMKNKIIGQQRFQNQGKNTLSSIIGGYKSAVMKHANRLEFHFAWQPRFYDRIIRDEKAFQRIRNYIFDNPLKWEEGKFNK